MISLVVRPSALSGSVTAAPSKSHTLRAIFFAFLSHGVSTIENVLDSPDTEAMIKAITMLGAKVHRNFQSLEIEGVGGSFSPADDVIDVGNSGITFRFIAAISALSLSYHVITGDHSIRHNRPAKPLIKGLCDLGARVESMRGDNKAPLIIKGPLRPGSASIDGADSQPVSALLIALSFLDGESHLHVSRPGEKPWIDLTLFWLDKMGIRYSRDGYSHYHLMGKATCSAFNYKVPGDYSTAAFPLVASIIHQKPLRIMGLDKNDVQGDKKIIDVLKALGSNIFWEGDVLCFIPTGPLEGGVLDINDYIDALPILSVLGTRCLSPMHLFNASIARNKESDRLSSIAKELKKMGAYIEENEDSLTIYPSDLRGANVSSHSDHRIAMSLAIAASCSTGSSCIEDVGCINKTYKNFTYDFRQMGAEMELV